MGNIKSCRECIYFHRQTTHKIMLKIFGVAGHCCDVQNKTFNGFAKFFGRGVGRKESKKVPEWCRFKRG